MTYQLRKPIQIVEYDPQWPLLFEQERQRILSRLGAVIVELEHFGSTSVPGLAAKPLADMLGAVRTLQDVAPCVEPLRSLGYEDARVYLGRWSIQDRRLFCSGPYNRLNARSAAASFYTARFRPATTSRRAPECDRLGT